MSEKRTVSEQAVVFGCEGEQLLGIVSSPPAGESSSGIGVVIVVGGPQYRAGSHRQFVQLARALAAAGHHCLRFDYRGMGDSSGEARDFLQVDADIDAAVTALLTSRPELRQLALWGLCDAASASLLYLDRNRDPRVSHLCLANPWVRSTQSQAKTMVRHYYVERLRSAAFWKKLFSGAVARGALREAFHLVLKASGIRRQAQTGNAADVAQPFPERMARAWQNFSGSILLVLSGADYTAKEFLQVVNSSTGWQASLSMPRLVRRDLIDADHTFSASADQRELERWVIDWLSGLQPSLHRN